MSEDTQQPKNLSHKIIESHLVEGDITPGEEIALKIDQSLTQDATGTMVMLELEAMKLDKVKTEVSAQYVDHNLLQADFKNADDHLFLKSACERFGVWYSRPGNGVSHPVHMERFGVPGKTLIGSDSHTPAAGGLGMLSFGAGGIDVAQAMAGLPARIKMPKVMGIKLTGKLPDWVSAKDVILEMLRRYDVDGCRGMILEYYGPGVAELSAMDRHVIANMGTETGATSTVFPSDNAVRSFLKQQGREDDFVELLPDEGCSYDIEEHIDMSELEPLIACPSSPGNVVPVREVEGRRVHQVVIGSSANPGLRDFAIVGRILKGQTTDADVSFDVNPTSRAIIENLAKTDDMLPMIQAGGRFHQAGCLGCIGMGQAPASNQISLRTMPRNFPGRSGTADDQVYLCSPETAAAAALTGKITDPRRLEEEFGITYPDFEEPETMIINQELLINPGNGQSQNGELVKGPNIKSFPEFDALPDRASVPVLLKVGNNISTDEIMPAGARVLPYRSNIPGISDFVYYQVDETFSDRAHASMKSHGGHIVVGGENYAQGSSREHAAIAPRYLGQVAVIAKNYARIGWQNLVNFGIVPLEFINAEDYDAIEQGDELAFDGLREALKNGHDVVVKNKTKGEEYRLTHQMSPRQIDIMLSGGVINHYRQN